MKKIRPPCIRNIKKFEKGCPQKTWDGEEGCTAWIELAFANRENPEKKEIKKQCIDHWMFEFQWATLGTTEGSQIAMEGTRNLFALTLLKSIGHEKPGEIERVAKKHLQLGENNAN